MEGVLEVEGLNIILMDQELFQSPEMRERRMMGESGEEVIPGMSGMKYSQ